MKTRWSIHQVYFYLVCFVTLILIIVGITNMVRSVVQIAVPIPEMEGPVMYERPRVPEGNQIESTLPREVMDEEMARKKAYDENLNKNQALYRPLRMLMSGLAQILVAVPVYLYHWRRIPLLN